MTPLLEWPTSQLCTQSQVEEPIYRQLCDYLCCLPNANRKTWEHCFILRSFFCNYPLYKALGFGVGLEPLPAYLAARNVKVTATDSPYDVKEWSSQHAKGLESLSHPIIVSDKMLKKMVTFRQVDMNDIPSDLRDFDACWSACALEHLGSLKHGLRFIENSLQTIKVGGLAVHTTEFNLSSNDKTIDSPNICLYRRKDIDGLVERLTRLGHKVWPVNYDPGNGPLDKHIDLPPYAKDHLKLRVGQFDVTSLGLVIQRGQ